MEGTPCTQAGGYGRLPPQPITTPVLATASLFSPSSLTFAPTANMSAQHAYHSMVTTLDGR